MGKCGTQEALIIAGTRRTGSLCSFFSHTFVYTLNACIMNGFRGIVISCLLILAVPWISNAQDMENKKDTLIVLWASGDKVVAEQSCLMYTHNAKLRGWFDEVVLIVWGASSSLLVEDKDLQDKVRAMASDGVILEACIYCSDQLGVTEDLIELGVDVKGMGIPLTEYLKEGYPVLTY
jgi:hypothetical protein